MPLGAASPVNHSIERAVRVLGLFSGERPELTLRQIGELGGMTKATAHRAATALRNAGLLRYADGAYTLGPRVLELAAAARAGLEVAKLAGPHLERLVADVGHTAVLSVWDGGAPVIVRVVDDAREPVRIVMRTGSRLPATSAQAQVFRAHLDVPVAGGPAAVGAAGVARRARSDDGIDALAAPVFQADRIVAAIALVATVQAIDAGPTALADRLCEAAHGFSAELGFIRSANPRIVRSTA